MDDKHAHCAIRDSLARHGKKMKEAEEKREEYNQKVDFKERHVLLDQFAGVALQALCVNVGRNGFSLGKPKELARKSYELAEAMMQERLDY